MKTFAWPIAPFLLLSTFLAAHSDGVWLDVPFVAQQKQGCGAAAVSMVLKFWASQGHLIESESRPEVIHPLLYSSELQGTAGSEMAAYLDRAGFQTFIFQGQWTDLRNHVQKGRPLIAALKQPGSSDLYHYVVVAGLDWNSESLLINDPAQRKLLRVTRQVFEKQWNATGSWTLLAVPFDFR